ncbi:HNH endonuclease [Xanthomonas phage Xop411]|uniref:p55.1 n=1 Tax=Xanthomonas phage Xop411 TaxID=2913975 RepID=A5H1J6_9CAUD|nr:HNH endonuclease [Xanthomonas phage Xop411]ABK00200.1 p55.1 [Xanthomonas phage Xop411]
MGQDVPHSYSWQSATTLEMRNMSENNELTFEDADKLLAYEPETGVLTWKVPRNGTKGVGSVAGHIHSRGYIHVKVHGKLYKAHRLAWLISTGAWPSKQLDHINGQRDDNRIENLRECTKAENQQNQGKRSDNTSGIQGVCWHKQTGKWYARIWVNGKQINLGLFNSIDEAAQARAAAKAQHHTFNPTDR